MNEYIKSLEILGLKLPANLENIKSAYHKLVKVKHPDKFQNSKLKTKATKEFKEINCAYNYLVKNYNNFHIDNDFENIEEDIFDDNEDEQQEYFSDIQFAFEPNIQNRTIPFMMKMFILMSALLIYTILVTVL